MAILTMNEIMTKEVLQALDGRKNVVSKTVLDLTSSTRPGMDRVSIPVSSGLALSDVVAGTRSAADAMTTTASVLMLTNVKQVHKYVSYANSVQDALDEKAQFLLHAPGKFAQGIEDAIIQKLVTANASDFESSATGAGLFNIADIAKMKKVLDQAQVPLDERFLLVNAEGMAIIAGFTEFQYTQRANLSGDALQQGIVGNLKGFNIVQQESSYLGTGATLKVVGYHREAVAFAIQDGIRYVEEMNEAFNQEFVAIKGIFGAVDIDNATNTGVRKVVLSCAV